MGESLTTHIDKNKYSTDFLAQVLYSGQRKYLVIIILYDVYNGEYKPYAVAE